jgi:hypothetical protein
MLESGRFGLWFPVHHTLKSGARQALRQKFEKKELIRPHRQAHAVWKADPTAGQRLIGARMGGSRTQLFTPRRAQALIFRGILSMQSHVLHQLSSHGSLWTPLWPVRGTFAQRIWSLSTKVEIGIRIRMRRGHARFHSA